MMQFLGAKNRRLILLIPFLILLLGVAVYYASFLPTADWYVTFDPAARGIFTGHSPYEMRGFSNPPWAVLLLLPFIIFPPLVAHGLFFVASALALIYLTWRLNTPLLAVVAFLLSPTAIGALLVGNLDPFVYLGMLLPPVWGLFVLLIKPQIGIGVAIYYLFEAWRQDRFFGVVRIFLPVAIAFLLSALIFPVFVHILITKSGVDPWNRSMFPYGLPLALFLLWLAVRRRNPYIALAASAFLTPYLTFYSYLAIQLAALHEDVEKVIRRDVLQVILSISLWAIMFIFRPG
jgi:hypothetical protein